MTTIEYIAEEAGKLVTESDKAFLEWGKVINNAEHTDEQLQAAEIKYFKASAAADAVKKLLLDLLAKGVNT